MISKLSILTFLLNITLFAANVVVIKEPIKFDEQVVSAKLVVKDISNLNKSCEPVTLAELQNEIYVATHYLNKNSVVCRKDIKRFQDESIVFSFGGLQIEKKGKIIYENNEFIRFKNLDGTIEQIYKDGRIK